MKGFAQDMNVQEAGLRCLAVLAAGNPNNQAAIYQHGGIPPVVNAVDQACASRRNDEQTVSLVAQGLNLLANLGNHAECRPQIVQCKGVEATINAMKTYHDPSVAEHGLRVIAGLAGSPETIQYMMKAGCLDTIISVMRAHMQDPTVQMNGCYAIGMLAGADDAKLAIARYGGIQALLSAMYFLPREAHVHEQGCAALAILAELDQNKGTIGETRCGEGQHQQDGVQIMSSSARNMCQYASAAKQCCKLIAVVALNEQVKDALLRTNTLEAIFMCLQNHGNDPSMLYYGLKAFVTLGSPTPPEAALHLCGDLIDLVVAAMQRFPQDVRVQECGCECFSVIARFEALQDPLIHKGAIKVICFALRSFQADTGVTRKGSHALASSFC
jgi:hypothetical protein